MCCPANLQIPGFYFLLPTTSGSSVSSGSGEVSYEFSAKRKGIVVFVRRFEVECCYQALRHTKLICIVIRVLVETPPHL